MSQATGSVTRAHRFTALCLGFPVCISHHSWIAGRIPQDDVWLVVRTQDPHVSPWLMDKQELGPDRTSYGPHLCPLSPMMHPERPVQPTSHRLLGLRRQPASPSDSPSLPPAGGCTAGGCPSASTGQMWKRANSGGVHLLNSPLTGPAPTWVLLISLAFYQRAPPPASDPPSPAPSKHQMLK